MLRIQSPSPLSSGNSLPEGPTDTIAQGGDSSGHFARILAARDDRGTPAPTPRKDQATPAQAAQPAPAEAAATADNLPASGKKLPASPPIANDGTTIQPSPAGADPATSLPATFPLNLPATPTTAATPPQITVLLAAATQPAPTGTSRHKGKTETSSDSDTGDTATVAATTAPILDPMILALPPLALPADQSQPTAAPAESMAFSTPPALPLPAAPGNASPAPPAQAALAGQIVPAHASFAAQIPAGTPASTKPGPGSTTAPASSPLLAVPVSTTPDTPAQPPQLIPLPAHQPQAGTRVVVKPVAVPAAASQPLAPAQKPGSGQIAASGNPFSGAAPAREDPAGDTPFGDHSSSQSDVLPQGTPALVQLAAPPASAPTTAPDGSGTTPHDFTTIVDRLVAARESAHGADIAQPVHLALAHAEFGQVSLKFEQGQDGLTVSMASPDPDFARAVRSAAPAQEQTMGGDTNSGQPGNGSAWNEASRQSPTQNAASGFDQSQGQSQGQSSSQGPARQPLPASRQAASGATGEANSVPASGETRPRWRNGIFA